MSDAGQKCFGQMSLRPAGMKNAPSTAVCHGRWLSVVCTAAMKQAYMNAKPPPSQILKRGSSRLDKKATGVSGG